MAGLWRNEEGTREGKYLVQRRDGTIPEWPWFVLGGADPLAPWALRFYAVLSLACVLFARWDRKYVGDIWRLAREYDRYRRDPANRKGDPTAGRHRTDDSRILALMRTGNGA